MFRSFSVTLEPAVYSWKRRSQRQEASSVNPSITSLANIKTTALRSRYKYLQRDFGFFPVQPRTHNAKKKDISIEI